MSLAVKVFLNLNPLCATHSKALRAEIHFLKFGPLPPLIDI